MTEQEHECEYKLIMEGQDSNMKRLMTDLEQLKTAKAFMIDEHKKVSNQLIVADAQLTTARTEIKKLEDEIMDCPADSAYHASLEKHD